MRLRRKQKGRSKDLVDEAHMSAPLAQPPVQQHSAIDQITVGDYAAGVPQIRVGEMIRVLGRQLRWALPAFLLGTAGVWYLTKDFKRTYSGEARVLVQLGSEYVYDPVAGGAQSGLLLTPDHIVLNETSIMTSEDVMRDVMGQASDIYGWNAIDPASAAKRNSEPGVARADFLRFFERNFAAVPRAKSSVIDLSFKHENPEFAVWAVNAFMDTYQSKRRELFVTGEADNIAERRRAAEEQLAQNEREIAAFLKSNNISDFESERTGATTRTEALKAELNTLRADIREAETALREVESQLGTTPDTINLYVDDRTAQRVSQAELELQQLLARYLPGSDPVRQKQVELAELRELQMRQGGQASGGRRVGPNPVQQELATRRNTLEAQADALREKEHVLQQQLNGADAKTRRLRDLSPRFENLLRERETTQLRLRGLNTKEQEAITKSQQAQSSSENVREITRATTARKGRNMRAIMFLLGTLAWGGTLFLLALLRTFLDPKLYTGGRTVRGDRAPGGRRASDGGIPEPVQPFIPATPAPPPFKQPYVPAVAEVVAEQVPVYADGTPAQPSEYVLPEQVQYVQEDIPAQTYVQDVSPRQDYDLSVATPWTPPEAVPAGPVSQGYAGNPYMSADVAQLFDQPRDP